MRSIEKGQAKRGNMRLGGGNGVKSDAQVLEELEMLADDKESKGGAGSKKSNGRKSHWVCNGRHLRVRSGDGSGRMENEEG